ncbi:MAG: NAD(P)H-binding protein [Bacteroidales bacterium]|nr:NAD(P)H-binding protein [Bacteroidales bacterium]
MKEVALTGSNCHIFADVLSALLHRGVAVHAFVTYPERLMLDDVDLTVSRLDVDNKVELTHGFEGYHDVIMTFNDDQTDSESNDFTLHHYNEMINAAREAGVSRVIVVGSPESAAFFMGDLRRRDDIDWVFISTEGDYADRTAAEVVAPQYHREEYVS